MQIHVIFALPSPLWCPHPLVPWAAAPVAYRSIYHCLYLAFTTITDNLLYVDILLRTANLCFLLVHHVHGE